MNRKYIALFFTAGLCNLKFVAEDGRLLELFKLRGKPEEYADIRAVHYAYRGGSRDSSFRPRPRRHAVRR